MSTLCFYSQFTSSKLGVNSLTVTWDIEQITRADGTRTALVTGGATSITVGRRGLYGYVLTNADLTLYDYVATAITATTTVDQQEVPALWTLWSTSWHDAATSIMTVVGSIGKRLADYVDAAITSRLAPTVAGRTLDVSATGEASVTVSDKTGYSLTADYDAAKTAATQVSVNAIPTTAPDNAGIAAIKARTDNLPSDPADESLLEAAIAAATSSLATSSALATVGSDVTAIKAKTDAFPASVASPTDVTNAKLDIIAAMPDDPDNAVIAAIKAKTDNLPSDPADESLLEALIGDVVRNPAVAVSATVAASVSSGALGLQTYYTFRQAVTSTATDNLPTASKLWLAIKNADRADSEALILCEKTTGLTIVNKAEYTTHGDGSLSVTGTAGDWEITIEIDEAATGLLAAHAGNEYSAEVKALIGDDTICVWSGKADIIAGVVRAYS